MALIRKGPSLASYVAYLSMFVLVWFCLKPRRPSCPRAAVWARVLAGKFKVAGVWGPPSRTPSGGCGGCACGPSSSSRPWVWNDLRVHSFPGETALLLGLADGSAGGD